jgi:hypothetical protein
MGAPPLSVRGGSTDPAAWAGGVDPERHLPVPGLSLVKVPGAREPYLASPGVAGAAGATGATGP